MDNASEYRKRARDCIDLSKRLSSESMPMLLTIAEAWTALAEQAETPREPKVFDGRGQRTVRIQTAMIRAKSEYVDDAPAIVPDIKNSLSPRPTDVLQ